RKGKAFKVKFRLDPSVHRLSDPVQAVPVGRHVQAVKTVDAKTYGADGIDLVGQKAAVRLFGEVQGRSPFTAIDHRVFGKGISKEAQQGGIGGVPDLVAV